jgi:uncharacterized protein YqjF (DUF2071 family)
MAMGWHDLVFLHWPVPAAMLRPLIPRVLEVDTFDGVGWIGVVPFRMSGVRPRMLPSVGPLSNFPELNVRTYVSAGGKPGVWFFSLDAASPPAVEMARLLFHLPYFNAEMRCDAEGESVRYTSRRTHHGARPARFTASYRPTGSLTRSQPGTLEHWLTERYCLYAANRRQHVWRSEISHAPWPLQPAEAEIATNHMTGQIGLHLPPIAPLAHFARFLDVVAWLPERIS